MLARAGSRERPSADIETPFKTWRVGLVGASSPQSIGMQEVRTSRPFDLQSVPGRRAGDRASLDGEGVASVSTSLDAVSAR